MSICSRIIRGMGLTSIGQARAFQGGVWKGIVAIAGPVFLLTAGIPPLQAAPPAEDGLPASRENLKAQAIGTGKLESLLASRPLLDRTLTVGQAVEIALKESPVVRGADAEVDAAAGRLDLARAQTQPLLSANTFLSGGSLPNIVESPESPGPRMIMGLPKGGYADQNLMVMVPLYTGGRLAALVRQAAALRGASEASREAQRQEVALMTRVSYREVQARQSLVEVARAKLTEDSERLRLDRERLVQQAIPVYYVSRDEAEVAASKQQVTNAERDALLVLSQLKTVMGISLASRLELVEKLEYQPSIGLIAQLTAKEGSAAVAQKNSPPPGSLPPGMPPELTRLLREAERRRPELRAAGERVAGAQAGRAASRAAYGPQVNLFGMGDALKSEGMRATGGVTYGVAASFPLYTGGADRAQSRTVDAERRQQEAERDRIALQVAKEVNDAYLTLAAAEQNVQTAQAALTAAGEEYQAAKARYGAGRSVVTEMLDSLTARVRAESGMVQVLYEYNAASDRLRRAVGMQ